MGNVESQDMRERFEECAFAQRFLRSIKKVGKGQFPFRSEGCPPKHEFCQRNPDDTYQDPTLDAMWSAWRQAYTEATNAASDHSGCHDLVCNGSRQHQRGEPGHSCSCYSRAERECEERQRLRDGIRRLLAIVDHEIRPPHEGPCTPESNCDGDCASWYHLCMDLEELRKLASE